MQFYFVEHVEEVLKIALLDSNAADQKTTERSGRESKPLAEPKVLAVVEMPVATGMKRSVTVPPLVDSGNEHKTTPLTPSARLVDFMVE